MQARSRYEIKRRKKEISDSLARSRCLSLSQVSDLFVSAVCVCLCACVVCCVVCVCVFDSVCVYVCCVKNILDSGSKTLLRVCGCKGSDEGDTTTRVTSTPFTIASRCIFAL